MSLPPPLPTKTPVSVIVIAILWALLSLLMLLGAIGGLFIWYAFDFPKHMPPQVPPLFSQMFGLMAYFDKMCMVQIVLGIAMLLTSIGFYLRMNWARLSVLFFSWLGIIYTITFMTFWITIWNSMTTMAPPTAEFNVSLFRTFGVAAGLFNAVFFVAPPAFLVWYLTQPKTKAIFIKDAENC